ncbi:magnesium transporter CorA family protein [Marinilactibacillus piezotolerans]|uniref:magnesium transporter CorA family protein n=1 Tax=Marinilactibacillus piezotolerans TaxID=258723 RepID=UPI0009B0709C|nr:magnesium transporter CorA family protein [Marinilactibacillus piezotolerans]
MIAYYNISDDKIATGRPEDADWIAIKNPTSTEIEKFSDQYDIPRDMFVNSYFPENITEIERFDSTVLGDCLYLVLINYRLNKPHSIEKGLYPITYIFNEEVLITITDEKDELVKPSVKLNLEEDASPGDFIVDSIINIYHLYVIELNRLKKTIDEINELARSSTKRDILIRLSDAERDMVFLEQTLDDQKETIKALMEDDLFLKMVTEERQFQEIQRKIKKTEKLVDLYSDLINSTSGLISEIIDNKLNSIMEYLDSAQLVITIPTLIFSLWGINTGGLLGSDSPYGSIGVVVFAILLGLVTYVYLRRKEY